MTPKASPGRKPRRAKRATLPTVMLIGCGNWGSALGFALEEAGVSLREIVVRKMARTGPRAKFRTRRKLLAKAKLDADVLWICTSDAAIAGVAKQLAKALTDRPIGGKKIVLHSSGALTSTELAALRAVDASVASVHPLMTFPRRAVAQPSKRRLAGVSFAIEGDPRACRAARRLVRALGGEPFALPIESKPLYHAFGAFASPMLVTLLTAALGTGVAAGSSAAEARRRMRSIVERTVFNFFAEGPEKSFSGPVARGDTATIARHLEALRPYPRLRATYTELTRLALETLPARNEKQIRQLLDAEVL